MRSLMSGLGLIVAMVSLAGCAGPTPEPTPTSLVGSSLEQAQRSLPPGTGFLVYDLSWPVADVDPTRGTEAGGTDADWIVVVQCLAQPESEYESQTIAFGVVSVEEYTPDRARGARDGEYDVLLEECR